MYWVIIFSRLQIGGVFFCRLVQRQTHNISRQQFRNIRLHPLLPPVDEDGFFAGGGECAQRGHGLEPLEGGGRWRVFQFGGCETE